MANEDMKKLKRTDLLDRIIELMHENEKLRAELYEAREKLADRSLDMIDAGSIAEASLKLNGVFEAAQEAADQYLDNIERLYRGRGELVREAQSKAQALVAQAKLDAQGEVAQARADAEAQVEEIRKTAKAAADRAREQARRAQDEADEARRQAELAKAEGESIIQHARDEALAIIDRARDDAKREAETILADARLNAQLRLDEAERVSRHFEMATKVKCDNTMRRAMDEAHTYGDTMRMAMHVLGITPDMVSELEAASAQKAAAEASRKEEPASQSASEEADSAVGMDDLERAVNSARAAVAAAISHAKTAPGTLDAETVAAMYPNAAEQL